MRAIFRSAWGLVLIVSIVANVSLAFVNFVMQPVWRAAAVASAVAATRAKAEVDERRAVAKARSKEKAKARLRRVAVAVPVIGLGAAAAFEFADFQEWKEENPSGDLDDYASQTVEITAEISEEVLAELPDNIRPDADTLMEVYGWILNRIPGTNDDAGDVSVSQD